MKFLGQYIQQFIARFRNDVYLEDISAGTIASGGNLGLDSNNKIVKANVPADGDITGISIRSDDGATTGFTSGSADFVLTGGVGINTTGDGSSTLTLTAAWADNENLNIGTGSDFNAFHDGTDTYLSNDNGDLYIRNRANDKDIIFQSDDGIGGATAYLTLDGSTTHSYFSAGNVGIGTTSPSAVLHAYATTGIISESPGNASIVIRRDDNTAYGSLLKYHSGNSEKWVAGLSDSGDFTNSTGNEYFIGTGKTTPLFLIDTSGNVGIGTASPQQLLDVSAVAGATLRLTSTGDGLGGNATIAGIEFFGNDASVPGAGVKSSIVAKTEASLGDDSNLIFSTSDGTTNNVERVRINPSGNVGIGTTSPSEKLDVDGDIKLSGDIELGHASDTTIARSAAGKVTIEGAPVQTTQMSMTHHHFFMNSSSTTADFFFPYNNLNEASSTSQYYTRTIAPYDGKIVKVLVRPSAGIGTACKLQFHKITDTTLDFGTAAEEVTSINLNTAETSVSTAFSSATFSAGDVVNVSLIKSSSSTANVQAVIVWEYTV